MPTVNQIADSDVLGLGGMLSFQLTQAAQKEAGSNILFKTATGFVWGRADPVAGSPGESDIRAGGIVVKGSNITYGADGLPSGGTITSISVILDGTAQGNVVTSSPLFEITGLAIDGVTFRNSFITAFQTGNSVPIENIFFFLPWTYNGSADSDFFHGKNQADIIFGNDGNDELFGAGGNNKLFGGAGDDFLRAGGAGADYISGGTGKDQVDYSDSGTGVTVSLTDPTLNTGNAAGDTYNSIENLRGSTLNDTLHGNAGANRLDGNLGADTLKGLAGSDRLAGSSGDDVLIGGLGADELEGADGIDTASYAEAAAGVTASLANPSINAGEAAGDTYAGIENLTGSGFADKLFGDNAANAIAGGAGDDIIKGYRGKDTLSGGAGEDVFVFNSQLNATTNVDAITDYNVAADTIDLDNLFFTALTTLGTLSASAFKNMDLAAIDASDRIIYKQSTGNLYYDADGSGTAFAAIKFATITNNAVLTNLDFVVI
ncbi:calcium-binding protein [Mesorhizobium sp. LHD-90]|uniref:calcium-binding protein n=1 Tax=Mesorhizobium sp. LHD-90 TaxID=3071414 RepID=UPI0027DFCC3D|nr:calcium-binding protein [Mesorhizobium sp. LHD-90]MDQ6434482.1 calcium-binding protein [Mesorhizobium sp. LHD-90]